MSAIGSTIRIVVADDHRLFREGLRATLEQDAMVVVGEADDGAEAARLARALQPDVVVLGLNLPGVSGERAISAIRTANAKVQIVVVTASADGEDAIEALAAGACAHLAKDMSSQDLTRGIRQAAAGSAVLSPAAMQALVRHVHAGGRTDSEQSRAVRSLTAREREVLQMIVAGADNNEIGRELSISPHTVKHYVTNILEKLGVHSRVEAAVAAVRAGLS